MVILEDFRHYIDWVFSKASNVSVAQDKEWFIDYQPFTSALDRAKGGSARVLGIGTVSLPLRKYAYKRGTRNLVLHNVLYARELACNIVYSKDMLKDCEIDSDQEATGTFKEKSTGVIVGFLDCPVLPRLRLKGQDPDRTVLANEKSWDVSVRWSEKERNRWLASRPQDTVTEQPIRSEEATNGEADDSRDTDWKDEHLHELEWGIKDKEEEGSGKATTRHRAKKSKSKSKNKSAPEDSNSETSASELNSLLNQLETLTMGDGLNFKEFEDDGDDAQANFERMFHNVTAHDDKRKHGKPPKKYKKYPDINPFTRKDARSA